MTPCAMCSRMRAEQDSGAVARAMGATRTRSQQEGLFGARVERVLLHAATTGVGAHRAETPPAVASMTITAFYFQISIL